jgi:hypothetical protein
MEISSFQQKNNQSIVEMIEAQIEKGESNIYSGLNNEAINEDIKR